LGVQKRNILRDVSGFKRDVENDLNLLMALHLDSVNMKNFYSRDDKSFAVNFIRRWKKRKINRKGNDNNKRIMFDAISVTNGTSYVPVGASDAIPTGDSEDVGDAISEDGRTPKVTPTSDKWAQKRPVPTSPPKKNKKKTFRDQCMKRLVDAYEKKAQSSKHSATSRVIDHVRDEVTKMLKHV
jgi:hypothetical protein